ncbi:unnamed protein product [Lactuca virosa]|uniref:CASP-like protein n=1 Tax=Lactuca virosa TaxID=75947 RepID=A0AAU9NXS1_9ASTR|nr:unnamed protein product [Lactuca virosa]
MTNDLKTPPETAIQLHNDQTPTTKVAAEAETGTMSGSLRPLVSSSSTTKFSRNYHKSSISVFGFDLPLNSRWSLSGSFQYVVGVSSVVGVHSLVQLVMTISRMLRKSLVFSSRSHAWLIFASDQVLAYAMISAGSAATGVTNLNRTGIKHTALPNFCKPLHSFCERVGVSIGFAFFNCVLLAISAFLDVVWLSS